MSFSSITSGEITSGQPVATTTQNKIKNNFDDHEARIQSLESGASDDQAINWRVNGFYFVANGILKVTSSIALNISGVRILIDQAGSAGNTEIDIQRKRGVGSFQSIFTTRPTIASSSGNDALSAAGTLDATKVDIEAGDILRLDITSAQTDANGMTIRIDFNRS